MALVTSRRENGMEIIWLNWAATFFAVTYGVIRLFSEMEKGE